MNIVPLTVMAKSTLRDFDVFDDQGRSLPLLGTESNGLLAASAIAYLISVQFDEAAAQQRWGEICDITFSPAEAAEAKAGDLILSMNLEAFTSSLVRNFARNFLLLTAVPLTNEPDRRVLKYAYHWDSSADTTSQSWMRRITAGLGWRNFEMEIELNSLDSARSYHLECSMPPGLRSAGMTLPIDMSGTRPTDPSSSVVAHAHGRYDFATANANENGKLRFVLDPKGLMSRIFWSALVVLALFFALIATPGSFDAVSTSLDAATALFLFVPAIVIAAGSRGPENDLVIMLLTTLRLIAYTLSTLLFIGGALLVLGASSQVTYFYWICCACAAAFIFVGVCIGRFRLSTSRRA